MSVEFVEAFTWFNVVCLIVGAPVILGFFMRDIRSLLTSLHGRRED